MEDAQNRFLLSLHRLTTETKANYTRIIERFREHIPPEINKITSEHIEAYLLTLQARKRRISTINQNLLILKIFFNWAEGQYQIENISKKVRFFPSRPPKRRFLSKEEYTKLIEANDGNVKSCLLFLANSGLRASEFVNLKPTNINGQFLEIIGKRGRFRRVPLNNTLKTLIDSNPLLTFIESNDRHWLNRLCTKAAKVANIEPSFSPHCLRRYFASQLYHAGISLLIVSRLLGHKSVQTTELYLGLADAELIGVTTCLEQPIQL